MWPGRWLRHLGSAWAHLGFRPCISGRGTGGRGPLPLRVITFSLGRPCCSPEWLLLPPHLHSSAFFFFLLWRKSPGQHTWGTRPVPPLARDRPSLSLDISTLSRRSALRDLGLWAGLPARWTFKETANKSLLRGPAWRGTTARAGVWRLCQLPKKITFFFFKSQLGNGNLLPRGSPQRSFWAHSAGFDTLPHGYFREVSASGGSRGQVLSASSDLGFQGSPARWCCSGERGAGLVPTRVTMLTVPTGMASGTRFQRAWSSPGKRRSVLQPGHVGSTCRGP